MFPSRIAESTGTAGRVPRRGRPAPGAPPIAVIVRHTRRCAAAVLLAFSSSLAAQTGTVGTVEVYGTRTVSPDEVRRALGVAAGDAVPADGGALRQRLLRMPGVADAAVSSVCCEAGRSILYAGIRELGDSTPPRWHQAPDGIISLPDDIVKAEAEFTAALQEAVERGQAEEDHSAGHALMRYGPARAVQLRFVALAQHYEEPLREVLATSRFPNQRALAAQVLAYLPDKGEVAALLGAALEDPSSAVRNDAARALWILAESAAGDSALRARIPTAPLIAMLHSLEWTDRNKSSLVLMALTTGRDPAVLAALDSSARRPLEEMARWRTQHALPAFLILGRIKGMPDEAILEAWTSGDRSRIVQ